MITPAVGRFLYHLSKPGEALGAGTRRSDPRSCSATRYAEFRFYLTTNEVIAHELWGGAFIRAVLGTQVPGPGTIYHNQPLSFRYPVVLGDLVRVSVTVKEKNRLSAKLFFQYSDSTDEFNVYRETQHA